VAFKSRESIDMDKLASFLQDAVEKVKTQEDPVELNEVKKVFKQNVPLTLRSYVAAYMLKSMTGFSAKPSKGFKKTRTSEPRSQKTFERTPRSSARTQEKEGDTSQKPRRNTIEESLAETIFISIGRNRRVFHRDLLSLITQAVELDRERIGDIRVLDNYSFVQVFSEDAQRIIDVLNGYEFRGRKLTVSFSRKKEEGTEEDAAENTEITESYETQDEQSLQEEV
jgi:hypothetical protein